ncbi:hypothetical protein A2592_01030 [Candidatus Kaiserbacteria bacterium RIFOXYD1_FULL_42_15]|uniref:DUF218 domain-containing protein n=1 Tax=Candidatus Kaiserbacteria bacterium RIFOXYD1_FULL_42_15 TaxID=1798532 RepID=A0A1F6FPD4_9BACT|nr:MAG: hypothetical protein A2592_01030 [Candidatus Kaiserbacteria bacterium RIFOXYD1_FULL_42_15]
MKSIFKFLGCCFLLLMMVIVICNLTIYTNTKSYIYDTPAESPTVIVALVPGAAISSKGELSAVFTARVDMAIKLYEAGKVLKILVSGDNSTLSHNEVNPARLYLMEKGVPSEDIFLDHAGFDTYSSMYRARDIFGVSSMIITTQSFHLYRSIFIARHLGIEAYGVRADVSNLLFRNYIREIFANEKAIIDLVTNRQPKFLGDKISIEGNGNDEPPEREYIHIYSPSPNQTIQSPLTITGEARGTWFFEASFPIVVTNWDGLIVGQAIAQTKADWMTEDFVPFEATLTFTSDPSAYSQKGTLIFKKDNPSGLPENDDAFEIPINFASVEQPDNTGILPFDSGVHGTVLRGPICPVMQNPPQPGCDDQPFEITIQIFSSNNKSTPFATTKTNSKGEYSFALPPGDYTLQVENQAIFPRCASHAISIVPKAVQEITINCDTGIR